MTKKEKPLIFQTSQQFSISGMGMPSGPSQPFNVQQALQQATQAHHAGQLAKAEQLLTQVLTHAPDHIDTLLEMGRVSLEVGKPQAAEKQFRHAAKIEADNPEILTGLGASLIIQGQHQSGEESLNQALLLSPSHPMANYNLGLLKLNTDNFEKAAQHLRVVIKTQPENVNALNALGITLIKAGNVVQAIETLSKAMAQAPNRPDIQHNLANALTEHEDYEEAFKLYEALLLIGPKNARLRFDYGHALSKAKKATLAILQYQQSISFNPNHANAYNNLGNAFVSVGKFDEAIDSFDKCLSLQSDTPSTYWNLAKALRCQGKLDEAIQALQTGLKLKPGMIKLSDSMIGLLNFHTHGSHTDNAYAKAQDALRQLCMPLIDTATISETSVRELYQKSHDVLDNNNLHRNSQLFQIWRGRITDVHCDKYLHLFKTQKVIPQHCFGCYKVQIEPRTVVELFKLMILFDAIELPNDNTRKCLVEVRPDIPGAYKALIYCNNLDDGHSIIDSVKAIIGMTISDKIPINLKRGCSEFPLTHPEYNQFGNDGQPLMDFPVEWQVHEEYADNNLDLNRLPRVFESHNHSGLTTQDAIIFHNWLAYAATIGDQSYLKITVSPINALDIEQRPAFAFSGD